MTFQGDDLAKFKNNLKQSAKRVAIQPLDHFPNLVAYRCLDAAQDTLANASLAAMQSGRLRAAETLTMPRHGFGPRPVIVMSPVTRTVYGALVRRLEPALVKASRGRGNWGAHHKFGREGDHSHVVDLDLTACYEFIDHRDLYEELALRSMDPVTATALMTVLGAVSNRSRGLPQMLETSDRLADTYLAVMDRQLERLGFQTHRYVDDFRILAHGWEEANVIVEAVANSARELGLTLSSGKTTIRRKQTVDESESAAETFLDSYFEEAGVDDERDGRRDPYEREDDSDETVSGAAGVYVDVLDHWHELFREKERLPTGMLVNIGGAIAGSASAETRLSDQLLIDLVFDDPLRLELVCNYLVERTGVDDEESQWKSMESLVAMGRQSPWAKLWLIDTASELLNATDEEESTVVLEWVAEQLENSSEVVRSEAAWVSALYGRLDNERIASLYTRATDVTAPAIAAAATAAGNKLDKKIVSAIRGESPLNAAASDWADD